MITNKQLPRDFLTDLKSLETAYLAEENAICQSGFSGGSIRWRLEREPILKAIESGGEILDVGCANGYLLECLMRRKSRHFYPDLRGLLKYITYDYGSLLFRARLK